MKGCLPFSQVEQQTPSARAARLFLPFFWSSGRRVDGGHPARPRVNRHRLSTAPSVPGYANVRSVKLTRLGAMLNSLAVPEGWSVQRIRTGGQNDGWSCGLWSLYTVMLTGRYVLEAQRADVCLDQYIFTALANEGLHDKTTGDRFLHVYFRHLKDAVANEQPTYAFDFNPHQHLPRLQMIADKAHVNGKRDEKHEGGRTYAEATKCALPECTVTQDVVGSAGKKGRLIARVDHKVKDKIIVAETGAAVKESITCCEDGALEINCENAGMDWKVATQRSCEGVKAECEPVPTSNPFGCLAETTSDETETISGTTSGESRPDMKKAVDISAIFAEVVARLGADHCKLREITAECQKDVRCTANAWQIRNAWNKFKCDNSEMFKGKLIALTPIFEKIVGRLGMSNCGSKVIIEECMKDSQCRLTAQQICNAWHRFRYAKNAVKLDLSMSMHDKAEKQKCPAKLTSMRDVECVLRANR